MQLTYGDEDGACLRKIGDEHEACLWTIEFVIYRVTDWC